MALLASYSDPADAALALNALQLGRIPLESRTVDQEGLEFVEIHVSDEMFDRACEVIEKHDAELMEARQKESHQRTGCPSCGAPELQRREDIDCSGSITGISYVMECKTCGKLFPR
ncbi:MAG: hypothetical protein WCO42_09555 [bacterium]